MSRPCRVNRPASCRAGSGASRVPVAPRTRLYGGLGERCACQSAAEPDCRAHTSNRYVPAPAPPVFQGAVALEPYACKIDHDPPGGWIQNWYWGLGQPLAAAVRVTATPGDCGEVGLNARVTPEHAAPVCSV